MVGQPFGRTNQVSGLVDEMKTRTFCSGVPTRKVNDDQGPSSPSLGKVSIIDRQHPISDNSHQFCEGSTDIGAGAAGARATNAARAKSHDCANQSKTASCKSIPISSLAKPFTARVLSGLSGRHRGVSRTCDQSDIAATAHPAQRPVSSTQMKVQFIFRERSQRNSMLLRQNSQLEPRAKPN